MSLLLTPDYVYPADLTGYIRQGLYSFYVNNFSLAQYLPNRSVPDIEVRYAAGGTGLADAGSYRAYDAEAVVVRRQAINRSVAELPPISMKMRMSEYDQLRMRKLADQAITDAVLSDAMRLTMDTAARVEIARGQALATGKLTYSEFGGQVVDFGRSPAHTVTAANPWSASTTDILNDLMTWRDVYLATNGIDPGGLLISRQVWNYMLRNQTVRNQVFPGVNQASIVTTDQLNGVLQAQGIPPVTLYQSQVNVRSLSTGAYSPTRVIPANVVIYTPAPVAPDAWQDTQLGATLWGQTLEASSPGYSIAEGDQPGIVAGSYMDNDPMGMWTKTSAITTPVLANPNLSFAATVF